MHFTFAQPSKIEIFNNMNDALLRASTLVVNPIDTQIGDFCVTPQGKIKLGSDEKIITRHGLLSYCKVLGIPPKFAEAIPDDLLLKNIDRLTEVHTGNPVSILERPDGTIASIVRAPYKEIPYYDILGRFAEKTPVSIHLSEQLLKMIFKFDSLKVPDLDENQHTFYVSEYLLSSLIKEVSMQAVSGLYKTQCSNSFIMPILGKLKANYQKDAEKRLNLFADAFECWDSEIVATVFRNLSGNTNHQLKEHQVKNIWDSFSKITGKSDADLLFSFTEETRQVVLANAKKYATEVKKAKAINKPTPYAENTIYKMLDVANDITSQAQTKLEGMDTIKAEILGGTIMQWMIFNN